MKVVIIGTGNVATVIARLLTSAGFVITQVYGRNGTRATELAHPFEAFACSEWQEISLEADLYVAALSDQALYTLGEVLRLGDKLIVHTAGSVSQEVLKSVSLNYGVLYPLQSLRKELDVPSQIPFLVDGCNEQILARITSIAKKISTTVAKGDNEKRLKLHIAAVITNNFTNHLYAMAEEYCIREDLSFELLQPLITETANRLRLISPRRSMTGPAMRNDSLTISRHLELLEKHPRLRQLYAQVTKSIIEATNATDPAV